MNKSPLGVVQSVHVSLLTRNVAQQTLSNKKYKAPKSVIIDEGVSPHFDAF